MAIKATVVNTSKPVVTQVIRSEIAPVDVQNISGFEISYPIAEGDALVYNPASNTFITRQPEPKLVDPGVFDNGNF